VLGPAEGDGESVCAGDAGAIVEAAGELVGVAWGEEDTGVEGESCVTSDPHADRASATSTSRLGEWRW